MKVTAAYKVRQRRKSWLYILISLAASSSSGKQRCDFLRQLDNMTNNDDYYLNDTYHPLYNYTTEDYLDDPNLEPPPFSYPFQFRIVCYILYNFIFTFGLIGNLLVFYTIHYTHPNMKVRNKYA